MRFFGTTVTKFAVVSTDVFPIRVDENGELSRWHEELGQWVWFDTEKFSDDEIVIVRQQGLAALTLS